VAASPSGWRPPRWRWPWPAAGRAPAVRRQRLAEHRRTAQVTRVQRQFGAAGVDDLPAMEAA
jgi:hypothetical protein